ncbi:unnamed protein product [Lymnaea stagnalis]|uniref:Ig-like domain-containing protein n=1 Tax=Lymnaea stagnalis TaxID=6523 RepID=A0AAV2HXB3_LYMST
MISSSSLSLLILILTATNNIDLSYGLTCPGPVEEGSTVYLTCSTESTATDFVWQLEVSGQFKDVSRCQVTQDCTNSMTPAFSATLDPSGTKNTQYDSVLTISRVSRNQTKFRCLSEICQLEVYVKPAKPYCDAAAALGNYGAPYRSFLEVKCTTASSYPRATCTLNSTLSRDLVARGSPGYTYTPLGDGNYMTRCVYAIHLAGFQTGVHSFTLVMASQLSTFVPNAATDIETLQSINIYAPSLTLDSDCPEGIIKSGMSATCTCKMTDPGYPEGWVQWYTSSNRSIGSASGDNFKTIILTYNPQNPCPTFECSPQSALGRLTPGLSYAPSFEENAGGCPSNRVIPISQDNSSDLIIGISVTVGCVLIALILGGIVFILIKRRGWKSTKIPRRGSTPSTTAPSITSSSTTDVTYSQKHGSVRSMESGVLSIKSAELDSEPGVARVGIYDQLSDSSSAYNRDQTLYTQASRPRVSTATNGVYPGSVVNSIRSAAENFTPHD